MDGGPGRDSRHNRRTPEVVDERCYFRPRRARPDSGDRPGNHRHDRAGARRTRTVRAAATASSPRSTRAGRGRARSGGDLGVGAWPRSATRSAGVEPRRIAGDRHHQPARDDACCGTARRPAGRTTPSSGRTAAPRRSATQLQGRRARAVRRASGPAWCSTRTSRRRRSAGCWTTSPALRARAEAGEIAFGTVDSFLIWRLTGGASHATDVTNASRTLLFDIATPRGTTSCCALFGVPPRDAARGLPIGGPNRRDAGRARPARRHPDRGRGRRPAGGAVRPGLHRTSNTCPVLPARFSSCAFLV